MTGGVLHVVLLGGGRHRGSVSKGGDAGGVGQRLGQSLDLLLLFLGFYIFLVVRMNVDEVITVCLELCLDVLCHRI